MRTNGKGNNPNAPAITVSYFESQGRVKNTDFTPITICGHVDYYMIESCHDGFKVMYMNMSIFCFKIFFKFRVKQFFMFC